MMIETFTKTRILRNILMGCIFGAIIVFQYRYQDYKDFINNIIEKPKDNITPLFVEKINNEEIIPENIVYSNDSRLNNLIGGNEIIDILLQRQIQILNGENEISANISYYDIAINTDKINHSTVEIKVINNDTVTNETKVLLTSDKINEESSFNSLLQDLPFCFYKEDISKPPIFVFSEYFHFDSWEDIKIILMNKKEINVPILDIDTLVNPRNTFYINSNTTEIKGDINIKIENDVIYIDSKSKGDLNISYDAYNTKSDQYKNISMIGNLERKYSIKTSVDNPYFILDFQYESISDYIMNDSLHQIIVEKINMVDFVN